MASQTGTAPLRKRTTAPLLLRRRTKIVATLGPASSEPDVIRDLISAGVGVFRLNMSHGDHESHRANHERIRTAARELDAVVAILADLCGPKIRVGRFPGGQIELVDGQSVVITTRDVTGSADLIPSQYAALADDVRPGCRVMLSDGLLELVVDTVDGTEISCHVVHGGVLKDRKGINLPDVTVSAPALTDKDREDARFVLGLGVEFLALSFVCGPDDVEELRGLMAPDDNTEIIAKIERPEALDAVDAILDVADGIMVARGDLGVELPPEEVPVVQRQLIAAARAHGKPSIVATQMLESMIESPQPTRAEVSDVSTAVFSGADAVMLSAETASGRFPLPAVQIMDRIARQIESHQFSEHVFGGVPESDTTEVALRDAVARSTAQLSRDLRVRSIVVLAESDQTAEVMSAARPAAPVIAVASTAKRAGQLGLQWGVVPIHAQGTDLDNPRELARRLARDLGLAQSGHYILLVSGFGATIDADVPAVTVLRA